MRLTYKHTMAACCLGLMAQAVVNNLPTLLFLTYARLWGITPAQITLLISLNFIVQLIVDALFINLVDRVGYRRCALSSSLCCFLGLMLLSVLPFRMREPFSGIIIACVIYGFGGGLFELVISPIVEAIPNDSKSAAMSLVHSFYSWGHVAVVLISTLLFNVVNPLYLPVIWSALPLFTMALFAAVPILELKSCTPKSGAKDPAARNMLLCFMTLMVCAGASEQAINQWSSYFAETTLGIQKNVGDLLGPCMFALLMGAARLWFSLFGARFDLRRSIIISSSLCFISYISAALLPAGFLSLAFCALCGLFVGILWPAVLSLCAKERSINASGFAALALGGDIGCALGPALVGQVYAFAGNDAALRWGILAASLFPLVLFLVLWKRRV